MSVREYDEAQAARDKGVTAMCIGALDTAASAAAYSSGDFTHGTMHCALAAQAFALGGRLLATPVPELRWWERAYVRCRGRLRGWRRAAPG